MTIATSVSPAMLRQENRDFLNSLNAPQVRALGSELGVPVWETGRVSTIKTALLKVPNLTAKRKQAQK
jgi:hypothetical protein